MAESSQMSASELVDSHCHLDFPDLIGEIDAVVARARAAGVTRMVTIATTLARAPAAQAIAEAQPGVFFAAGVHPMEAAAHPAFTVEDLARLAQHPRMVGIGETGLDYHYSADSAAGDEQGNCFAEGNQLLAWRFAQKLIDGCK